MTMTLYVGDRNYSSWSLRPWLVLQWSGLNHGDEFVSLDQSGYGVGQIADVLRVSPSGRVPALHTGDLVLWDSLAIAEWVAEQAPQAELWPRDAHMRALARAVSCEMHSGFVGVRRDLPMNIRYRTDAPRWLRAHGKEWSADTASDLARLDHLLTHCRAQFAASGPFLFGRRSIADAFYTPIAVRMRSYAIPLSDSAKQYCATLLNDAAFRTWEARALADWKAPFSRAAIDNLYKIA
jgi:glutathione S-transferase